MLNIVLIVLVTSNNLFADEAKSVSEMKNSDAEDLILSLKNSYRPKVVDGNPEPAKLPDLIENRKTIDGIDTDKDNIRDDLEIFINRAFENNYERDIFRNYVKKSSALIKGYSFLSTNKLQEKVNEASAILSCYRYLSSHKKISKNLWSDAINKNISAQIYNTRSRYVIYNEIMNRTGGISSNIKSPKDAYEVCPKSVKEKFPMSK